MSTEAGEMEGKATAATRLLSLDAFRGITVAGMILVNNPGSWGAIYSPLAHAEWHGWTPTDLVFPFFLFIVGVSVTLALSRRAAEGGRPYGKILRRAQLRQDELAHAGVHHGRPAPLLLGAGVARPGAGLRRGRFDDGGEPAFI